jgi:hypothetical protein
VCAAQWARCVNATADATARLPADRVLTLHYERLVTEPAEQLRAICRFLDIPVTDALVARATAAISASSVGGWRHQLTTEQLGRLDHWLRPTLGRYGYLGRTARKAA